MCVLSKNPSTRLSKPFSIAEPLVTSHNYNTLSNNNNCVWCFDSWPNLRLPGRILYETTCVKTTIIRQRHIWCSRSSLFNHFVSFLLPKQTWAFETDTIFECVSQDTDVVWGFSLDNHQGRILLYSNRHVTPDLSRAGNSTPLSLRDSDSCYATDRRHTSLIRSDLLQNGC